MRKRYASFIAALLFFSVSTALAQELTISGTVLDANTGEPLLGAVIRVRETGGGAITDALGKFRLVVKNPVATLSVKLVGYKERTVVVNESTSDLVIRLQEDVLRAEEVVVTGIATGIRRENSPTAIGTLKADELLPAPAQTVEQAFAAKIPGLSISQNTGAPGGGISINLRGVSTLVGNSQPLIFVDGVIISNDQIQSGLDALTAATGVGSPRPQSQPSNRLADINPNDIEDIQILKGPTAAAVYGAKAAAGVIIITTKQGRPTDKATIDFSQQTGFSRILKKQGTRNWAADTTGYFRFFRRPAPPNLQFIDYEEELYGQTGLISETNLSVRGGGGNTIFYLGGTARTEQGIIRNTGYSRYSARVNVSHRFSDNFIVDAGLNYINTNSDRSATGNSNNNVSLPYLAAFIPGFLDVRPQGGVYTDPTNNGANPFEIIDKVTNNERIDRVVGSLKLDWTIFRAENQQLKFVAQGGADYFTQVNTIFSPINTIHERLAALPGRSIKNNTPTFYNNIYTSLVHSLQIDKVSFTTSAGVQIENRDINSVLLVARGLPSTSSNLNQAANVQQLQTITKQYDQGLYVQEDVDIDGTVFLTLGLRADRSSANGDVDKFYFFPKGGASLLLSKLSFWESLRSTIESAKIRVAAGQAGTFAPPIAKFTTLGASNIGGLSGLTLPTRPGNPNIEPERVTEIELGFDLGLAGGFASLEFSYYLRQISGLVVEAQIAPSSGGTTRFENGGEMRTNGIEVALNLSPVRSADFNWDARINFFRTTAEITDLKVPDFTTGGFGVALGAYYIGKGYSPTTIVGRESFGPNPNAPNPNARPGQFNGLVLGDELPNFRVGFSNSLRYKGFELYFLWDWKQGGNVINLTRFLTDLGGTSPDAGLEGEIQRTALRTGRNPVTGQPTNQPLGTPWIEDGTFLRLRELALTYTFDRNLISSLFGGAVSYLRVGITGRNLLLFTPYAGYDPEVSNFGNVAIGRSVDVTPFPSSRQFYFNLSFGL